MIMNISLRRNQDGESMITNNLFRVCHPYNEINGSGSGRLCILFCLFLHSDRYQASPFSVLASRLEKTLVEIQQVPQSEFTASKPFLASWIFFFIQNPQQESKENHYSRQNIHRSSKPIIHQTSYASCCAVSIHARYRKRNLPRSRTGDSSTANISHQSFKIGSHAVYSLLMHFCQIRTSVYVSVGAWRGDWSCWIVING
jgi:hypothetical protein